MHKYLPIFVISCFFFSCASQQHYHDILRTWEGKSGEALVDVWGYPDREITAPNGNRVYVYEESSSYTQPVTSTVYEDNDGDSHVYTSGGQTYFYNCSTYFELSKNGRVVKWRTKGNSCTARESGGKQKLRAGYIPE